MVQQVTRAGQNVRFVSVDQINVSNKKLRKLSRRKVEQYARDYENGDTFPAISVQDCGDFYVIRDGRHRFQAQLIAGFDVIAVSVE